MNCKTSEDAALENAELELSAARAAVARKEPDAERRVGLLLSAPYDNIAVGAAVLASMCALARRDDADAAEYLERVELERAAMTPPLSLQIARAWTPIEPARSRERYRTILAALTPNDDGPPPGPDVRYFESLARYRLGHLVVDDNSEEALTLWRATVDARSPLVAPYAALALASCIGEHLLLRNRVEQLYDHALYAGFATLCSRAALAVAEHYARRERFDDALKRLAVAAERGDPAAAGDVRKRIAAIEREKRHAPMVRSMNAAMRRMREVRRLRELNCTQERVIIVGAGAVGQSLLASLLAASEPPVICGFIDDDKNNSGVADRPEYLVLGRIADLKDVLAREKPNMVYIAIPSLSGRARREVVKMCWNAKVKVRDVDFLDRLRLGWTIEHDSRWLAQQTQPVQIGALIGERARSVNLAALNWRERPRAMVIGVGSLGTEVARALACGGAEELILLDRDPLALINVTTALAETAGYPKHAIRDICGDLAFPGVAARAFTAHEPSIVFFTAAWPDSDAVSAYPIEAARNEVLTVADTAEAASTHGIERFVYVSKGRGNSEFSNGLASFAEAAVLTRSTNVTRTAVVRSAPLLESRESIVAAVRRQIERGEVKVSAEFARHRYLSAADAAELTLLAARDLPEGGDDDQPCIFEPVGEAVDAHDVAHDLVRLAGRRAGVDVPVTVEDAPDAPVPTPEGEPHDEDERLLRVRAPLCKSREISGMLAELRKLVDEGDERAVRVFALTVETRLQEVCRLPPRRAQS